ncbi:hypothetical protein MMC22_006528 [Lobaria immixta]|nr:hypothetical protein [Lobaria immixta]
MDLNAAVEPPPPGVTSNFDNPESRAYETVIVFTIYLTIMMSIFLLRIYSKIFVTRSLGWDDYTCVLGLVGTVASVGIFSNTLRYGVGRHNWDIEYDQFHDIIKYLIVYILLYGPTIFLIKISILILYLRLFSPDRLIRSLICLGMGYTLLANSIVTISFGALCAPRKTQSFLEAYQTSQCVSNIDNLTITTSVVNLVGDIYILILPIAPVLKLKLSTRKKIAVVGVFMTGLLACVFSLVSVILRVLYIHKADYMYWSPRLAFTVVGEMVIGIICACMPACAAVLRDKNRSCIRGPFKKIQYRFTRNSGDSASQLHIVTKVNYPHDGSSLGHFDSRKDGYLELGAVAEGLEKMPTPALTLARSGSWVY